MAKTPAKTATTTDDDPAVPAIPDQVRPRIGEMVYVQPVPGRKVINTEVGTFFPEGVATPQLVTVTTLRRLDDGDLIRMPAPAA